MRSRQSSASWSHYPSDATPPENAPNVLLILTDDVGFSATSTFGGAIPTPTFDALARQGLRYNQFHTTAMCSPTRAALLTGRNHHAVGTGAIADLSTDEPGYTSVIPKSAASIARVLKEFGYDTAFLGKNHNTPEWETGPMGPFDRWPNGFGFDYFYGFHGKSADQFAPSLVENRNPVDPPADPDYHLDRDLSDKLIHWLRLQRTLRPGHPFFAYLAPGTLHSPHQAPRAWIEKFRGRFDLGWDRLREETFARQKMMGIIPSDAALTPRSSWFPAWDDIAEDMRGIYAYQMEVAAGQLAHSDHQIGLVIDELRASGQFDNTLVVFIHGDNGASLEMLHGANNENMALLGVETTEDDLRADAVDHGGPDGCSNYSAAWAWATNTPYQWGKQVASHLGGLRDGLVVCWPRRIKASGQVRSQFHHVIDIAPTIYEAIGITPPPSVDGVAQQPIDGISMVYSFDDASAPSPRTRQYFEMLGYRSIYRDGWLASTTPQRAPWVRSTQPTDPAGYDWELYRLADDFSQARDLADAYPELLARLRQDFTEEAKRYNVDPIAAFSLQRVDPANRPSHIAGRQNFTFYPGPTRYSGHIFPAFERGGRIGTEIEVVAKDAVGPIIVKGDLVGGAGLYLANGRVRYIYNATSRTQEQRILECDEPLTWGLHRVELCIVPVGEASRAARLDLLVDGHETCSAHLPIYYEPPGDVYIGRPGIKPMIAGQHHRQAWGFTVRHVTVDRAG